MPMIRSKHLEPNRGQRRREGGVAPDVLRPSMRHHHETPRRPLGSPPLGEQPLTVVGLDLKRLALHPAMLAHSRRAEADQNSSRTRRNIRFSTLSWWSA